MAAQWQAAAFSYRRIELYKSERLGSGAYGAVCKAKCDGLLCAAKIMHPVLFDLHDPGAASYLRKFQEECHLLSLARHPNVVQYLCTYTDPDTRLPVLLMELCRENLTAFLERSSGPLPFNIQVNICHDIVLALAYLHSNGLIHRDLTGNNVLIDGSRAKITDFGMSKIVNHCMKSLSKCPGNVLYMSPEALDEAEAYTAKLDIFSFGVLVIQIVTRKFPNPANRFIDSVIYVDGTAKEIKEVVSEVDRRKAHLNLIPDTHSLKPLALQCLKQKENERPTAEQLSEELIELKQSPQYSGSQESRSPLERIVREAVVVHGNTAYFSGASRAVYSYQQIEGKGTWCRLPDHPKLNFGLAIVEGLLVSVGGWKQSSPMDVIRRLGQGIGGEPINTLYTLREEGGKKKWCKVFTPMPTPRLYVACVTTEEVLLAAGGEVGRGLFYEPVNTVEVMNIETKLWSAVSPLPQKCFSLSASLCGDTLYLAGGSTGRFKEIKTAFSCHITHLLSPREQSQSQRNDVWKKISSLPVTGSTLVSFDGSLLAIGGKNDSNQPISDVYTYDSNLDCWNVTRQMNTKRHKCFAVVLLENLLIVVGGNTNTTDSVEVLN